MPTVWTEVLGEGLSVTWLWYQGSLLQVPIAHEGYHLHDSDLDALDRYAQDKEFDLLVEQQHEQSDFEGSLEDFVKEELAHG